MKRALLAIPAVLIVLIAVLLIAPGFIDWSAYKTQAQEQVQKMTGLELTLAGDLELAILPSPRLSASGVQVEGPEGSRSENLLSLKRLDIHVAILPLLRGEVAVDSISLVDPNIVIERFTNGRMNWMTPEIEARMAQEQPAERQQQQQAAGDNRLAEAISFNKVSIDNGSFTYLDHKTGQETQLSDIDAVLRAETLQGPYKFDGDFGYSGYEIALKGGMGRYSADTQSIVPQIEAQINPGNIQLAYSGVVSFENDAPEAQGETTVYLENLGEFLAAYGVEGAPGLNTPLTVKGLLTASGEKAVYKDLNVRLGAQEFTGSIEAALEPMNIEANLAAEQTVNLDSLMPPASGKSAKKQQQGDSVSNLLPPTVSMPSNLNATFSISAPAVLYKGHEYGGVTLAAGKKSEVFPFLVSAKEIPGKGALEVKGDLRFGSSSVSEKTGAVVYADPALGATITGQTQNLPFTLQSLAGVEAEIPYTNLWKSASATINLGVKPDQMTIENSTVKLGESSFAVSGSYSEANQRPAAAVRVSTGALNWDQLKARIEAQEQKKGQAPAAEQQKEAKAGLNPEALAQSLKLPFDLTFDVSADSVIAEGKQAGGVQAKGAITANTLNLEKLAVNNFADASLSLQGKIDDIENLSGMDFRFSGNAQDVQKLASAVGASTESIPAAVTRAAAQAQFSGNLSSLNVTSNIEAAGGELIAQGVVRNPLTQLAVDNLKLQVKHPNTAQAIKAFNPGFKGGTALAGPLDFYTEVQRDNKLYTLQNMKGSLAGTPVQGTMSVDMAGAKPFVKGDIRLGSLTIDAPKKGSSVGVSGSSTGQSTGAEGMRWSREAIDFGWLHAANADLALSAQALTYGPWPLQEPDIHVAIKDGVMNLNKFNAGLYGGQVALNGVLKSVNDPRQPAQVEGGGKLSGVQIEEFIRAFAGNAIIKGSGDADMTFSITASGISPAALVYDLGGEGTVNGRDIVLEGLDLTRFARALSEETKPGDTVLGLWKGATKGGSTAFQTLNGNYTIAEGVINLQKMDLTGEQALVETRGTVDLPRWMLATTHKITLHQRTDIPPFTVKVSGPLDNPAETFGQSVLQDYLNRKIERKVQQFIGEKLGLPQAQPQSQQQASPQQPEPAPDQVAPSGGEEGAQQQQPQQQQQQQREITPEEAIGGLIKGLLDR